MKVGIRALVDLAPNPGKAVAHIGVDFVAPEMRTSEETGGRGRKAGLVVSIHPRSLPMAELTSKRV